MRSVGAVLLALAELWIISATRSLVFEQPDILVVPSNTSLRPFRISSERYNKGPVLITKNLGPSWSKVLNLKRSEHAKVYFLLAKNRLPTLSVWTLIAKTKEQKNELRTIVNSRKTSINDTELALVYPDGKDDGLITSHNSMTSGEILFLSISRTCAHITITIDNSDAMEINSWGDGIRHVLTKHATNCTTRYSLACTLKAQIPVASLVLNEECKGKPSRVHVRGMWTNRRTSIHEERGEHTISFNREIIDRPDMHSGSVTFR